MIPMPFPGECLIRSRASAYSAICGGLIRAVMQILGAHAPHTNSCFIGRMKSPRHPAIIRRITRVRKCALRALTASGMHFGRVEGAVAVVERDDPATVV